MTKSNNKDYKGSYNRLFPGKVSTTSFLTIYVLYLFSRNEHYYGKEIIDAIEDRFAGNWKPSHGIVYPMLRNMEAEGLLTAEWEAEGDKRTKRFYKITEKGRSVFESEVLKYKEAFFQSYNMMVDIISDLYDEDTPLIKL